MRSRGLTSSQVAAALGCSRQWIEQMANKRSCTLRTVTRLAATLQIPEEELIEYQPPGRTAQPPALVTGGRWYLAWEPAPGQVTPSAEAPAEVAPPAPTVPADSTDLGGTA